MLGSDNSYRLGGPHDDVAENIRNEQRTHGIDRNPSMECDGCGESYNWEHYKNHGSVSNDPEKPLLCAACNGFGHKQRTVDDLKAENRQLAEFGGVLGDGE